MNCREQRVADAIQQSLNFFLQLRGPATALSRKFLHDLTTGRHFKSFFFVICTVRIFTMKTENFQLRGNNSVCAGPLQILRGRAPAQLRGNADAIFCQTNPVDKPIAYYNLPVTSEFVKKKSGIIPSGIPSEILHGFLFCPARATFPNYQSSRFRRSNDI
jgi:hypothetical protein